MCLLIMLNSTNFNDLTTPDECSLITFFMYLGEHFLAEELATKVRIYCFILTVPAAKKVKAVHVKATWARRFDKFVFISSEDDPTFPTLKAVDTESRKHLWLKTRFGVITAYRDHLNDFDFFMKADDDTYVIVENLRLLLSTKDPNVPMLMGRKFNTVSPVFFPRENLTGSYTTQGYLSSELCKLVFYKQQNDADQSNPYGFEKSGQRDRRQDQMQKHVPQGYTSGGAGYVLSRAGLKLIAEGMLRNETGCEPAFRAEDLRMGLCAQAVGVKIIDSLDEHGRETFHPFKPATMVSEKWLRAIKWYRRYNAHPLTYGVNCCSDHSISFHYMRPADMYMAEYLFYHLYPYGITRDLETYRSALEDRSRRGGGL
ncbi:unnamed protein product [Dibothriocephalus latus]|uniref:N-acetylgalactosaminide beta-1,3-galactosyltransferase n=1 Tax=Dibothriocephalus latus TaxID=60516 RepID=A0A3P6UD50_DIBLA|nr:unnamed protein product [Dibothriocephalus latus]